MRGLARSLLAGFSVVAVCAVFVGACSNQAEGERCEAANGNDDCQDGLVCDPNKSICCPVDPRQATTPGCVGSTSAGGEAGIPQEASTGTDSSTPVDSATDAPVDSSSSDSGDDAADANDDGG